MWDFLPYIYTRIGKCNWIAYISMGMIFSWIDVEFKGQVYFQIYINQDNNQVSSCCINNCLITLPGLENEPRHTEVRKCNQGCQ